MTTDNRTKEPTEAQIEAALDGAPEPAGLPVEGEKP